MPASTTRRAPNAMAHPAKGREDCSHPERVYKNLLFSPNGEISYEDQKARAEIKTAFYHPDPDGPPLNRKEVELCWSCGWSAADEVLSSYGSRVRIFHTRGSVGIWELGSRWLVRDQPNNATAGNDFITQEFLRNHQPKLDIPLVKEMRMLSEPTDKVIITLMSRVDGVQLDTIWFSLSAEQKTSYSNQLRDAMKQWRQFTSTEPKKVDGSQMDDCIIGFCHRAPPACKKIGRTTEEWLADLDEELRYGLSNDMKTRDSVLIDERLQELKINFPKSEPYVLTHGDLNLTNIIVKDDKIQAIIDWEPSGYMPWWAERYLFKKWNTEQSWELLAPIWVDLDAERDDRTFHKEVVDHVEPIVSAWRRAVRAVEHTQSRDTWHRPGFCECKPWAGEFKMELIGNQPEHKAPDMTRQRVWETESYRKMMVEIKLAEERGKLQNRPT